MSNQRIFQITGSWRTYVVLGLVYLLVTACTLQAGPIPVTGNGQTPEAESDLANTKWMLVSFGHSGVETPVIVGSSITLEFDTQGQAGGSGGCNMYGPQYQVRDNMISIGEITRTLVACEQGGIGEQELRYFQALESASTFELVGDRLTIWYGDQGNKLNFVAATSATSTVPPTALATSTPTARLAPTSTAGSGSSRERVEFEPGAISATRSGDLPTGGVKEYVLRAFAGQMMHIQTVGWSAPVEFTLDSPGGATWSGQLQPSEVYIFTVQVILPQTGDYVVTLSVPPAAGATNYDAIFTVYTTSQLSTPPPVGSPERVNFPPGATSATRSGDMSAGGVKEYVLWASAGQSMHIQTVGYNAPVEFTLTSPNGETWSGEPQPSDVYIFTVQVTLPHYGDYLVRLSAPADSGSTRYDVIFTVTGTSGNR